MGFEEYDDEQLDDLRVQVISEQERRLRLDRIPREIVKLQNRYVESGGDVEDLPGGSE